MTFVTEWWPQSQATAHSFPVLGHGVRSLPREPETSDENWSQWNRGIARTASSSHGISEQSGQSGIVWSGIRGIAEMKQEALKASVQILR